MTSWVEVNSKEKVELKNSELTEIKKPVKNLKQTSATIVHNKIIEYSLEQGNEQKGRVMPTTV